MSKTDKIRNYAIIAIAIGFAATIAAVALSGLQAPEGIVPLLYLIGIAVVAALFHKGAVGKPLLWLTVVGVAGWLADVVAVRTGVMFGVYEYGGALGFKLCGVPVAMVLLWATIVYLSLAVAANIEDPVRKVIVGAGTVVLFDLLLEPSASILGMWQFSSNQVPFQNYMVWFVLAYFFTRMMKKTRDTFSNSIAMPLYWVLVCFLLLLDFTLLLLK